nr:MAG TPA: hypothetical protein [Caudoviricetes sp.]DAY57282.1 MAG TPA: hypothetical protein [Caudoviricetes sp.]
MIYLTFILKDKNIFHLYNIADKISFKIKL